MTTPIQHLHAAQQSAVTSIQSEDTFPQDPAELGALAERLLSFYADCLQADGRPRTAQESRALGRALRGAIAALAASAPAAPQAEQPGAVPDGWKLVPVEPTREMCDAAVQAVFYGSEGGFTRISGPGKSWAAMLAAAPAAPMSAQPGYPHEQMDAMALARYKVVPAHESMLHSHAVVAGDGTRQLYLGREIECQNMAQKFAGAFLDGAFAFHTLAAPGGEAPAPAPAAAPDARDAALNRLIAAAEIMVSTVDSYDSDALLELDEDPHPPSAINADADSLHRAVIAYKAAQSQKGGAA